MNERDSALENLPKKNRYPLPPDLLHKMQTINQALVPSERYAQQKEQTINTELNTFQKFLQQKR